MKTAGANLETLLFLNFLFQTFIQSEKMINILCNKDKLLELYVRDIFSKNLKYCNIQLK